jgi:CheY-like chemotaxis protein
MTRRSEMKKILIVDDDEGTLKLLETRLTSEKYQVFKASKAKAAIEKAKDIVPDLILMDIMLPDLDGSEAVKLLRKNPATKKIPVIFLSGIVDAAGSESASEITVGDESFEAVGKPVDFNQLLPKIEQAWEE